jgi:hypothetical protein
MLTPKVATGALAGAASVILVWIIGMFHPVPPEISSAFTTVFSTCFAYFAPMSQPTPEQVTQILQTNTDQQRNQPKI